MYAASSREAISAARSALESVTESAWTTTVVGDELLEISSLIRNNRDLLKALTDKTAPLATRCAIAKTLLKGKVDHNVLDVILVAVKGQWSHPSDFVSGIHELGVLALLSYAHAMGDGNAVEDELFRLGRIIEANPELEQTLSDRSRCTTQRAELLRSLIANKVKPVTEKLAVDAIERAQQLPADALASLSSKAASISGHLVAHVCSATALSDNQRKRLTGKLAYALGSPVTLHVDIDPGLLGGVVVRVGNEKIDGSIASKFDVVRRGLR